MDCIRLKRTLVPLIVVALLAATGLTLWLTGVFSPGGQGDAADGAGPAKAANADSAANANAKADKSGKANGGMVWLVRVADVQEKQMQARWQVVGRLREVRRTTVGCGQQGRVIAADIEEGDVVVGSQTVLAQIDQTFARIALREGQALKKEAEAQVGEAIADFDQAKRDRQYLEELAKSNSAQPREVRNAISTEQAAAARVDRAKARVLGADAAINRTEEEMVRFKVVTPTYGSASEPGRWIVVRKIMEVGQWVAKGAPVAELVSTGKIDAVLDVPERLINRVERGAKVDVHVEALDEQVPGVVVAIIPQGMSAARTFPVKVRLDDLQGRLKAGMSVTASIPTSDKTQVLTVPRDAVLRSAQGSIIWVVKDDKAQRIAVEVLFAEGDRFAVKPAAPGAGPALAAGMHVVIEGGERLLFPGQAVKLAAAKSDKAADKANEKIDAEGGASKVP